MGIWMIFRRRWRLVLWLTLMVVAMLNAAVFLGMPGSKLHSGGSSERGDREASHLQVIRKRLNKSSSNSSSLTYVDWEAQDGGAIDPDVIKMEASKHRLVHKDTRYDHKDTRYNQPVTEASRRDRKEEDVEDSTETIIIVTEKDIKLQYGGRANYSLVEIDEFVRKFQAEYSSSLYSVDDQEIYDDFLKRLNKKKKKGSRLSTYVNNRGKHSWERFHYGIHQHYLYDPNDMYIGKLQKDLNRLNIINVEQKEGGTQIKLIITFEDDGQALLKPMRHPREQETLPDHFYFADYERHNAEIAAFHLDMALGFYRVPPTIGRWVNVSRDIHQFADSKLAKTFFVSPAGNWCFHGSCSYYCDSSHPICGHPIMLETSLAAFLPPWHMAKRKTWRNPWKRSYSKHRKAYWEVYNDLCDKVKKKHPYNEGRRLLDVLDMSVFDFLTGNLDRHHYETFMEFGNDTFLLHLDNGRAFGKAKYDCISCLAPVRQCCMIRLSTLTKLIKFYIGPESLSKVMRASMAADPVNPILLEPHLDALDRRVSKILHVIQGCIKGGLSWEEVIVDDGVT